MNELRDNGLMTEEQVKTAKYYGIAKETIKNLLIGVQTDLKID